MTTTRVVSRDGKIMTLTAKGTNAKGQAVNNLLVFDLAPRQFVRIDTSTKPWEESTLANNPALRFHWKGLFEDPETGMEMSVVRYPAGVINPRHTHPNGHGMYVPEGRLVTSRGIFGPGTFVWFPEGEVTEHGAAPDRDVVVLFVTKLTGNRLTLLPGLRPHFQAIASGFRNRTK